MSNDGVDAELARGRSEIERVDKAIIALLAERVTIGRRIGELKRAAGLPVLNPSREAEVIRGVADMARDANLPVEAVREIFWRVVALSRQAQEELA
jgi:chorismate mutase